MKEIEERFKEAVNAAGMQKGKFTFHIGKVSELTEQTCTVGMYKNVRLNAIVADLESSVTIFPKEGSTAIVGRIENKDEAFLVATSEIDRVRIQIEGQLFELKDGKFSMKNEEADLKEILSNLFDQLNNAIITTPAGPGFFSPDDKAVFVEEKLNTEKLFE